MKFRTRLATILLAWLVLIPIGVLAPAQVADAAPEEDAITAFVPAASPTFEFGERLSASSANKASLVALPTERRVARPEFEIWPGESLNQVVNLESFLMITDGFESKSWCWCFFFFTVHFSATPIASKFEFTELDTGARSSETCPLFGQPFIPGVTNPPCGKDWYHSSDITGQVEAKARVLHTIVVTGDINMIYPAQSRASNAKTLTVGEVMNLGQSLDIAFVATPEITAESGFCSFWGISVLCWVGEQAAEAALAAVYAVLPVLEEVAKFFDGCADAVINAAGGLVDLIRELRDAISDPGEFIDEKLQEFRDLIAAIEADPEGFARDVLGDIAQLDRLDEEGVANWIGSLICTLAIDYFTGKLGATILVKARQWLRDRNNPDRPDTPNPNCVLSSFPGDTQVLMADGNTERIDAIRPGDYVLSHNVDTSVWEPRLVVDQWSHLDRGPPATATLTSSATITATDDHLFWRTNDPDWVELQYLTAGDTLLTPTGTAIVDHVTVGAAHDWMVWELTVHENHNFTVLAGDDALLVHNGRRCPGEQDDINDTNHPEGRATVDEAAAWGRYLERMEAEGTIPLTADEWLARKRDLDKARLAGSAYERDALNSPDIDLPKNTTQIDADPPFIPDGIKNPPAPPARAEFGDPLDMVEVKNVQYLSDTGNVSAMIDHVQEFGGSLELVIGPQTTISGPLRTRLEGIGATVGVLQPDGRVINIPISEIPGQ